MSSYINMAARSDVITSLLAVISPDVISTLVADLSVHLAEAAVPDGEDGVAYFQAKLEEFFGAEAAPAKTSQKKVAKAPAAKSAKADASETPGEVVVVLNYGPKSHALFGDTASIKDKLMGLNPKRGEKSGKTKLVNFKPTLGFGPGWVVMDKDRLSEVTEMFDAEGITYREIERKEYEVEVNGEKPKKAPAPKTKEPAAKSTKVEAKKDVKATSKAPAKAPPKKETKADAKSTKAPPKETKADAKAPKAPPKNKAATAPALKANKNKWGNSEEDDTGIIFLSLPVGAAGRMVPIAIGTQDVDAEYSVKELASVLPLTDELIEQCETAGHRILTDEVMSLVEKKNKTLHGKLVEMRSRGESEPDVEEEEGTGEDEVEGGDGTIEEEDEVEGGEEGEGDE
jgi:hypothetical protein